MRFEDLEIDLDYQEVRVKGNKIDLTTLGISVARSFSRCAG